MGSIKGKWTERVECASNAEAQVTREGFRRKGMLSRIRRIPVSYQHGNPVGGTWAVQARMPKNGPNTYRQDRKDAVAKAQEKINDELGLNKEESA